MTLPVHGGDIEAIAARYGVAVDRLTDFSANINPYGPPPGIVDVLRRFAGSPRTLAPYPAPQYQELREALAHRNGVPAESVIIGAGGAALLDAAVRASRARAFALPVPAFSEYRRALSSSGCTIVTHPLGDDFELDLDALCERTRATPSCGAIVNTPHNPSGRLVPRAKLEAFVMAMQQAGRPVIVDEAFIDYVPSESVARACLENEHLVVVRSLTKFYALAGVRIGYAIVHPSRADDFRSFLPSWPAGTMDAAIAHAAVTDDVFANEAITRNARAREHLMSALATRGVAVVSPAANFLCLYVPVAPEAIDQVIERLIRAHGIVVRDCRSYERLEQRSLIRVAVLDDERNANLVAALVQSYGGI